MTVVDLERQRIRASVRELAGRHGRRGWPLGVSMPARAALGRQVHERYRAARSVEGSSFRAEVPVGLRRQVDGFAALIQGRIDGVHDTGTTLIAEEVKSVHQGRAGLDRLTLPELAHFALQAQLYALCLAEQHPERTVGARLILISVLDGAKRTIALPFTPQSCGAELDGLLRHAIAEERHRLARGRRLATVARQLIFPHPAPRPHQLDLIEAASGGLRDQRPVLAMAPTGTGKTVCALLAALRHGLPQAAATWFVTAMTTQQQLAASAFDHLCEAAELPVEALTAVTIRAKARMCPVGHLQCHPDLCPLLDDLDQRLDAAGLIDELMSTQRHVDPDLIYERAAAAALCPFELSLALAARAELVIGDYNYVYAEGALDGARAGAAPSRVVVVDEAHNLFDRCREAYSAFLSLSSLRRFADPSALGSVSRIALPDPEAPRLAAELAALCADGARDIERLVHEALDEERWLVDGCCTIEPAPARWARHGDAATRWLLRYAAAHQRQGVVARGDPVVELLGEVSRLGAALQDHHADRVPYAACDHAGRGPGIGIACVDPARWLAAHHRAALGTIAMSATLAPLSYYADVLGFGGMDPVWLSVPSPFPRSHRHVAVVPSVATTYRERWQHAADIATLIEEVVQTRPGHYVAFFPSFAFLSAVRDRCSLPPEQILIQLPQMSQAGRTSTLGRLRMAHGPCLLLAVLGGVFAEGVDLPGDALIGAIIVGPGLPPMTFERALMGEYFDERGECGQRYALLYPAMQRVIQAAGRVIRTMDDRGVVVLLGRRFAEAEFSDCFPPDWYQHSPAELCTVEPAAGLRAFWHELEKTG